MDFDSQNAEVFLRNFFANIAFISPGGISLEAGITVENTLQAKIKKIMIENSATIILLVESNKFNISELNEICSFSEIDKIITDKMPTDKYIKLLYKNNIDILY